MSAAFGFNNYSSHYMSRVVLNGGTTPAVLVQWAIDRLSEDFYSGFFPQKPLAVYPFYGGNAASHALNLFSVRDKYTITWSGTVTHSSNGMTGDGAGGVGLSDINPAAAIPTPVSYCYGIYCRTNTAADVYDCGLSITGNVLLIRCRTVAGNAVGRAGGPGANDMSVAVAASTGLFTVQRQSSSAASVFRNGTLIQSSALTWSSVPAAWSIAFGGAAGLGTTSARNLALGFVAPRHQTAAESATLYNNVQAFQTTLARNV